MAGLLKYYTVGVETRQLKTPAAIYAQLTDVLAYTTQMYKVQATTTEHAGIRPEDWIDFPIGLNENSFTDPMPQPGVTYIYRVKALKANGIGGTTNPVEVSMP